MDRLRGTYYNHDFLFPCVLVLYFGSLHPLNLSITLCKYRQANLQLLLIIPLEQVTVSGQIYANTNLKTIAFQQRGDDQRQ